jgi:hypothetical protein
MLSDSMVEHCGHEISCSILRPMRFGKLDEADGGRNPIRAGM